MKKPKPPNPIQSQISDPQKVQVIAGLFGSLPHQAQIEVVQAMLAYLGEADSEDASDDNEPPRNITEMPRDDD